MPAPCPACHNPTPTGTLCTTCTTNHTTNLTWLTTNLHELTTTTANLARTTSATGKAPTGRTAPIPINLHAAAAQTAINTILTTWALRVTTSHHQPPPGNAHHALTILTTHLTWTLHQSWAVEYVTVIRACRRATERIIDRHTDHWYAGPCNTGTCTTDLYPRRDTTEPITCPTCGTGHDPDTRRQQLLTAIADQLVTATEAAAALTTLAPVATAAQIRRWAQRGLITAHGTIGSRSHPTYRLGDILTTAKTRRQKHTTS